MPELSLAQLAEGAGGRLLRGDPDVRVKTYSIDTRRLEPGGVFFALRGERSDGHRFVGQAAQNGAAAAVVEREPEASARTPPALIRVEDSREALSRCAVWIRRNAGDARWLAVTGSNGKTTTKEMIAEGLSGSSTVHRTPGNFNNELGVPLTLLALPADCDYAVIELAMNAPGEIAALTRIVDPDVALVTNVRAVHMASFATIDDVAAAKGELFALLRDDAISVVNLDDLHVRVQSMRHVGRRVTFGRHPDSDLRLEHVENRFVPGAALSVAHAGETLDMQLRIGGAHAAHNALAALAAVAAAGGDVREAASRIERLEAGDGRGRIHRLDRGIVLVDDSYNSSPPALAAVLETLSLSQPAGRRVLVLGDMLELGPMEKALHRETGRRAGQAGVQLLFGVGPLSREAAEAARRSGVPQVHHYSDSSVAAQEIFEFLRDGDLVVIKGSRSIHMGRVVRRIVEALGGER